MIHSIQYTPCLIRLRYANIINYGFYAVRDIVLVVDRSGNDGLAAVEDVILSCRIKFYHHFLVMWKLCVYLPPKNIYNMV